MSGMVAHAVDGRYTDRSLSWGTGGEPPGYAEQLMGRVRQKEAKRGSQKWLQLLVNERPHVLLRALHASGVADPTAKVQWVSPLRSDAWAEYRDAEFLRVLALEPCAAKLAEFWPQGGPQWDGLGKASDGTVVLIEAKAHIPEMLSRSAAKSPKSVAQIEDAFGRVKSGMGVRAEATWTAPFYQYANRVAHLFFLEKMCNVVARLVFIDFVGDREMGGPATAQEWQGATAIVEAYLGIGRAKLRRYIHHLCIDVAALPGGREA